MGQAKAAAKRLHRNDLYEVTINKLGETTTQRHKIINGIIVAKDV